MRSLRLAILTIAAALVLVPTLARAHQQVEHREATRLSIKHSWVGVAPPTKASVAPVAIAVLPVRLKSPPSPGESRALCRRSSTRCSESFVPPLNCCAARPRPSSARRIRGAAFLL